jgi:hypothetical protein
MRERRVYPRHYPCVSPCALAHNDAQLIRALLSCENSSRAILVTERGRREQGAIGLAPAREAMTFTLQLRKHICSLRYK